MHASAGLAMCLAANCKNGISSYELHRCLGQRTTASKQSCAVLEKTFLATVLALIFSFLRKRFWQCSVHPIRSKQNRETLGVGSFSAQARN